MNDALVIGLKTPHKQKSLDDGFNMMSKFCWDHGALPDKDFGTLSREGILEMLMDDMSLDVVNYP